MSKAYALNMIDSHDESDLEESEILEAFCVIYGRHPSEDDITIGLYRLCSEAAKATYTA